MFGKRKNKKTETEMEIKTIRNIESVGVEIESCSDNSILWRPVIENMEGSEYLHGVEWHNDGSIDCTKERRKLSGRDMTEVEYTAWVYSSHLNYLFKLYETLYEKVVMRQNPTTGNHVHLRFKEPIDYYIVTSPSFIFNFQRAYIQRFNLDSKYMARLSNRYSAEYTNLIEIIDNQLSGSRYRTINALSLLKHRNWTVEFRILPYADSPQEYKLMVTWLVNTVDQLISEYKAKLRPLNRKLKYDKEGVKVGSEILGNDALRTFHDITEGIPALSWVHIQESVITDIMNRKYGLGLEHMTYGINISPLVINYVYYHDLSTLRKKAYILSEYNAYVDNGRVLIPNNKAEEYNRIIGEKVEIIKPYIRNFFRINTTVTSYVNSPDHSDSVTMPIPAITIRYDWNTKDIKMVIGTGAIRSGGYVSISVDSMAKTYTKDLVELIKFLKEYVMEFKIMTPVRQVIA